MFADDAGESSGKRPDEILERFRVTDRDGFRLELGWDGYQAGYQDTVAKAATKAAPWHIVPADNKWFTRLVVAAAIVDRLDERDPRFPNVDDTTRKMPARARKQAGDGAPTDG